MHNLYGDESGDVGYSRKSTENFIYTFVKIKKEDEENLRRDLRKYMKSLIHLNPKRNKFFHASTESSDVINKLIKILSKYNVQVYNFVYSGERNLKYEDFLPALVSEVGKVDQIYISRFYTREAKNELLVQKLKNAEVVTNSVDFLLQMADLFAWITFQKFEKGQNAWYEVIEKLFTIKLFQKQNP